MGKKNLEQLFKDTFQDFQEVPDEKVWKSIEASLDKKKQRKRVIPIWWQLGGIAAALAVLFYVINPFGAEQGESQIITDAEKAVVPTTSSDDEGVSDEIFSVPTDTPEQKEVVGSSTEENITNNASNGIDNHIDTNEGIVAETHQKTGADESNVLSATKTQRKKDALALSENITEPEKTLNENLQGKNVPPENASGAKDAIAENNVGNERAVSSQLEQEKTREEVVALNDEPEQPSEKKSIFDAIKEQEMEEEALAQGKSGKWSVGPSVAPVYYNASGNGSPIHSDFSSNSKSGNLNLSYGLTVGYDIGKKLKIRSGVHRVNYGYDTNDVVFSSTLRASSSDKFANIDYSQNSETIVVQSKKSPSNSLDATSKEIALGETPVLDGKMVQQLGYIEVPLELNYALLDKKFGVDLIGGVSSLFLVDNSVLLESDDLVTEMGEANNVNSLNFSANVGMGLNYEFAPKFQLNIEPVFKYQLNTFSKTAGDFRPFSIGVYSGVRFKF